jgi:hypothetical protein
MKHQTKLLTRQLELDTCHKSLLQGIGSLQFAQHAFGNGNGNGNGNGVGGGGGEQGWSVLPSYGEAVNAGAQGGFGNTGLKEGDDALIGFLEARKRRGARKKGDGETTDAGESQSIGQSYRLHASPSASNPIPRKEVPVFEMGSPTWTAPAIRYSESPTLQDPHQQSSSIVELGSNPARPMIPELASFSETPRPHPQPASLSPLSTMSELANCLSPTYNSSFFPSAPPTPYFPPAQPNTSVGEGRQRALSAVGSTTELSAYTERTMTPTPNDALSQSSSPYWTRHSSMSGVILDPAANAPEVAYAAPPLPPRPPKMLYDTQQNPYQQRMHSYDSSLPEVVPSSHYAEITRHSSLPEVVHDHLYPPSSGSKSNAEQGSLQRSATQEQRERRKARLNLISEG